MKGNCGCDKRGRDSRRSGSRDRTTCPAGSPSAAVAVCSWRQCVTTLQAATGLGGDDTYLLPVADASCPGPHAGRGPHPRSRPALRPAARRQAASSGLALATYHLAASSRRRCAGKLPKPSRTVPAHLWGYPRHGGCRTSRPGDWPAAQSLQHAEGRGPHWPEPRRVLTGHRPARPFPGNPQTPTEPTNDIDPTRWALTPGPGPPGPTGDSPRNSHWNSHDAPARRYRVGGWYHCDDRYGWRGRVRWGGSLPGPVARRRPSRCEHERHTSSPGLLDLLHDRHPGRAVRGLQR